MGYVGRSSFYGYGIIEALLSEDVKIYEFGGTIS